MEKSASAPGTFDVADYSLPKGGFARTVPLGGFSKDTGKFSSRINQIEKQAGKFNNGPGKYVAHYDYGNEKFRPHSVHAFSKMSREYKGKHFAPPPVHYEDKADFRLGQPIACRSNLSNRPRVLLGGVPKGKRRSFLDQAQKHGRAVPGPGHVSTTQVSMSCLNRKISGPTLGDTRKNGTRSFPADVGPGHYNINLKQTEGREPDYTVPKEKSKNFIDKAVRSAALDTQGKEPSPGPGHHNSHQVDHYKISRGTKYCQLRGVSRSPVSGYF